MTSELMKILSSYAKILLQLAVLALAHSTFVEIDLLNIKMLTQNVLHYTATPGYRFIKETLKYIDKI